MSKLTVVDRTHGDLVVEFTEFDFAAAETEFKERVGSGHLAYRAQAGTRSGTQIREFDPTAEEIILTPQLIGG